MMKYFVLVVMLSVQLTSSFAKMRKRPKTPRSGFRIANDHTNGTFPLPDSETLICNQYIGSGSTVTQDAFSKLDEKLERIISIVQNQTDKAKNRDLAEVLEVILRRNFSTYFYNFYDQMAASICASVSPVEGGLRFPVRRECGEGLTCQQICSSPGVRSQIDWSWASHLKTSCVDSFHLYKGRPHLAPNPGANTDNHKINILIWRYASCDAAGCGPNYCCCKMQ